MSTARDKSSESSEHRRLLRCVNCSREMPSLHVQYSPGNIRLMKCEQCKAVADPYIECEFMLRRCLSYSPNPSLMEGGRQHIFESEEGHIKTTEERFGRDSNISWTGSKASHRLSST